MGYTQSGGEGRGLQRACISPRKHDDRKFPGAKTLHVLDYLDRTGDAAGTPDRRAPMGGEFANLGGPCVADGVDRSPGGKPIA